MGHDHVASQLQGYATLRSTSIGATTRSEDEVLWVSLPLSSPPCLLCPGRLIDANQIGDSFGAVTEEFEVRDAIAGILHSPSRIIGASA